MEAPDEWHYPFDGALVRPYMTADRKQIAADPPAPFTRLDGLRGLIVYRRTLRDSDHK